MQQFTLKLKEKRQRPSFVIHDGIVAMLDTGALYPVWTKSEELLIKLLNAKLTKRNVPVSGFGGTTTGNAYTIPLLKVGNIMYPNMQVIASSGMGSVPFNLILSATMFQGLIYEIDTVNNCFNVTIPDNESHIRNYKILDSNGNIHILCQSADEKIININNKESKTPKLTKEDVQANYMNSLIKKSEK